MALPSLRKPTAWDMTRLWLLGAIWGASFLLIEIALKSFSPIVIAAARIFVASLTLLIAALATRQSWPTNPRDWITIFLVGIFNTAIPFYFISWGQQFVAGAETALLMATGTFFAMILAHFFSRDEKLSWLKFIGLLVGFSGVFVLVMLELFGESRGVFVGQLAIMLAACSYAASSVIGRHIAHLPPVSTSAAFMLSATVYMVPLAFVFDTPTLQGASFESVTAILFLGVVATALAFFIRFFLIRDNGAVFMSQVGYLVPLFGVLWGWVFASEAVTVRTWVALGLIVVGINITRMATVSR